MNLNKKHYFQNEFSMKEKTFGHVDHFFTTKRRKISNMLKIMLPWQQKYHFTYKRQLQINLFTCSEGEHERFLQIQNNPYLNKQCLKQK